MSTKERAIDRGKLRASEIRTALGREIHHARTTRGLSSREVGASVGLSASAVSRIERALVPEASVANYAQLCAVLGLELSARAYPADVDAIRDAGHARLLARLKGKLHPDLTWRTEVPLPNRGDQRSWDGTITAGDRSWMYGVEAETRPSDGQALTRRLESKRRDGKMGGVILLISDTRTSRAFRRDFAALLEETFPARNSETVARLAAGQCPTGSCVVVL